MTYRQATFDDLGTPLCDATFCVVDLETTGGSPVGGSRITEIGAVKVRGGEVLGEFQTLVNPDESIPAFITVLTGITDQMVVTAPRIAQVLPSFLEFAHGSVLVAHNAPFDVGFLRHNANELGIDWPSFEVVDTVTLARRSLLAGKVRNHKLSTLAARFSAVVPDHRALTDARATVDVMHAMFERLGPLGVTTVEEVIGLRREVSPAQRRKRHLADKVPDAAGVYLFRSESNDVLYVGTSRSLRRRVRTYFTSSETRSRMGEMVALAGRVDSIVCTTALEAQVRELRLIAAHRPPYNRRSKFPERVSWIKLTHEPWPRLSIVTSVRDDGATYIGPFGSRRRAEAAVCAIHEAFPVRQCTGRMAHKPAGSPCALADMGRCLAPCDGRDVAVQYADHVERLRTELATDPITIVSIAERRMAELAADERFEDAATWRDRLAALLRGVDRTQRLRQLTAVAEIVAAAPRDDGGWDVHVIRYGRLAAAGVLPRRTDVPSWVEMLLASAEAVVSGAGTLVEETETLLRWLESPGVRMVRGAWSVPLASAARHLLRVKVQA